MKNIYMRLNNPLNLAQPRKIVSLSTTVAGPSHTFPTRARSAQSLARVRPWNIVKPSTRFHQLARPIRPRSVRRFLPGAVLTVRSPGLTAFCSARQRQEGGGLAAVLNRSSTNTRIENDTETITRRCHRARCDDRRTHRDGAGAVAYLSGMLLSEHVPNEVVSNVDCLLRAFAHGRIDTACVRR